MTQRLDRDNPPPELESLLEVSERKADILTNLLKEADAEYEQTLEKIRISEANFRAIFENAPEAIYIVDTRTRIFIDCNPFMIRWLGYSRKELLSMRVEEILALGDKTDIQKIIKKTINDGLIHIHSRWYRKKDGSVVEAEITGTLLEYKGYQSAAVLVRDITQRRQIEALGKYKELFENVSDPVFINDSSGNFLEVNDVACELFGYTRNQLLKMSLKQITALAHLPVLDKLHHKMLSGEIPDQFELNLLTRKGSIIPFEFQGRIVQHKDKPAFLSVARNLSIRKQLEETLIRAERLSAVGEMASGVAHNFNNLLQMISAGAEAALKKLEAGNIRDCHEAIHNIFSACRRGGDVVRRIKDFTLAGNNNLKSGQAFNLDKLIDEAVELTRPLWKPLADPRKFHLDVIKGGDCFVKAVSSEIFEVLVNLIKNGIEAMENGGRISIETRIEDNLVFLVVSDSGCGIPNDDCQRIFEPFFTTKGAQSSGLGLSSCYGIIKKFQGDIHVESKLGNGSRFIVTFPLASSEKKPDEPLKTSQNDLPIRFLLIDDEENILKSMRLYFEDSEIELTTAASAKEGIRLFSETYFDVILCDFGMDDMNGLEVACAIKDLVWKNRRHPVPFLLYTGLDKQLDDEKLKASGVWRVVNKPTSCQDLTTIIREVIAGGQAITEKQADRENESA